MQIPFSKYSGCGNDFILIDNRCKLLNPLHPETIKQLCHRRLGIGADGIILLELSSKANFRMRIFNADGSEAEMCGNGLRCLVRFIQELGISGQEFLIETMHQLLPVRTSGELVSAHMPTPRNICLHTTLHIQDTMYDLHSLDTGVPHVVIFVDNIHDDQLMTLAPKIRYHPHFLPKGTNVNFACVNQNQEVYIRTYERGVEGETLACGTGAAAVAIAAACVHGLESPVVIRPKSEDTIRIGFKQVGHIHFDELTMTGPALKVFSGITAIPK